MSVLRLDADTVAALNAKNRAAWDRIAAAPHTPPPRPARSTVPKREPGETPGLGQAKTPPQKQRSHLEVKFEHQLLLSGLPTPVPEFYPLAERNFRIDFAWPQQKLAVEVDGAVHRIKGRFHSDLEKHALLLLAGWRVLRIGSEQIKRGQAIDWIRELLG